MTALLYTDLQGRLHLLLAVLQQYRGSSLRRTEVGLGSWSSLPQLDMSETLVSIIQHGIRPINAARFLAVIPIRRSAADLGRRLARVPKAESDDVRDDGVIIYVREHLPQTLNLLIFS